MNTEYDIPNLPNNIQDKLVAYDRIRETQRKYSKAYIAKISDTDEYRKKQRDYYHKNKEEKQKQGRANWQTYYNKTGKEKKNRKGRTFLRIVTDPKPVKPDQGNGLILDIIPVTLFEV